MDEERREWEKAYAKRSGRFVEEQYVEDEDEWEEGRRSARMLGCVFLGSLVLWIVAGGIAWIVVGPTLWR